MSAIEPRSTAGPEGVPTEWNPPAGDDASSARTAFRALHALAIGALAAGLAPAGLPPWWATGYVPAFLIWRSLQPRLALASARAKPIAPGSQPRLENLVDGAAARLGRPRPDLFSVDRGGPNALVCRRAGRPVLAVSRTLLDSYTRTELEAVVVHCLLRSSREEISAAGDAAATWPLVRGLAVVGPGLDARTVESTRFPPALGSAVVKAEPRRGRFSVYWFVGEGPSHTPAPVRAAALADL